MSALGFGTTTVLAQAAPTPEVEWYERLSQFGFAGLCLGIIFYILARTLPEMLKQHQVSLQSVVDAHTKCVDGLSCNLGEKMDHMAAEIRAGNDSQLALLRANLHKKDGQ